MSSEMKKGKTFKEAVASWKGSGTKSKSNTAKAKNKSRFSRSAKPKSGGNRTMGKGGFNTQKMLKYVRLAALGAPAIAGIAQYGFTKEAAVEAIKGYTGVNLNTGGFDMQALIKGYTPFLASTVLTYGIPKVAGILRGL